MQKNRYYEKIHEDEYILVLSKSAGVLTIPDRYDKDSPNLYTILKDKYREIYTVHRLDRDTSGVMIFAKTPEAHKNLNTQFEEHTVKKIYHAVISGIFLRDEISIDIPIAVDTVKKGMMKPSVRGKASLTHLRVLERFRSATLVELELVTGRHHQIRVHCSSIGHPLLIDDVYGGNSEFYLSSIKRRYNVKKNDTEKPLMSRITMHSYSISFLHPGNNDTVSYSCVYPRDFNALLQVLKKYSGYHSIDKKSAVDFFYLK